MLPQERDDQGLPPVDDMPASLLAKTEQYHEGKGLDYSLQLGDMGVWDQGDVDKLIHLRGHYWFRGNHDNPDMCRRHPGYLSDWGFREGIFWMGGGFSIDWTGRHVGNNFWDDEELSYRELLQIIEIFADTKPQIMISHECPTVIKDAALTNQYKRKYGSRTEMALQTMWECHQPELWVFGHHHKRIEAICQYTTVKGYPGGETQFIGLGELSRGGRVKDAIYEIPGVKWDRI